MSDSVRPHRWQPTRLPRPWDSPGKNIGVGCHFLLQCMKMKVKVKSLSRVQLLATPWTAAYQAPPSMGFSRQEYWSGVPLPSLHGTTDWFQIGKGVCQGYILSLCLFNFYAEYIMRNAGLEEAQAGIKIAGRNINNLRYADDTTLMAESEEELKSLLTKVKVESEKVGLKLNIQKTKIMASSPITSWEIDGETVETVSDFVFFGLPNHCRW